MSESGAQSTAEENATSFSDTPEAQFERLLTGVRGNEDEFGWVDVESAESELPALRVGSFISVRRDLYIPSISKALASADKLRGLSDTMKAMSSFQSAAYMPPSDLPDMAQVDALVALADAAAGSETVIGESTVRSTKATPCWLPTPAARQAHPGS